MRSYQLIYEEENEIMKKSLMVFDKGLIESLVSQEDLFFPHSLRINNKKEWFFRFLTNFSSKKSSLEAHRG